MSQQKFNVIIPAQISKAETEGEWKIYGLASTPRRDLQGEVVDINGLDLSPIEKNRGILNFEHQKGPENTVGAIDTYKRTKDGLYLGGYLFKNHDRAKALYQIMSSLRKNDRGRMGLSIEGVIKERDGENGKIIKHAVITGCALTMNPVNTDTYTDLVKSLAAAQDIKFDSDTITEEVLPQKSTTEEASPILFTPEQVVSLLNKALGVGGGYATSTPAQLTGGDALAQEDLDKKPKDMQKCDKCKKAHKAEDGCVGSGYEMEPWMASLSMRPQPAARIKKSMVVILKQLQDLYPEMDKAQLWEAMKDRLNTRFPDLKLE